MSNTNTKIIIGIDPSGNWGEKEGFGTTGIAVYDSDKEKVIELYEIKAEYFKSRIEYWRGVLSSVFDTLIIYKEKGCHVVIEDFKLQTRKALQQSGESMATPRLLGILEHTLELGKNDSFLNFTYSFQLPSIKSRFPDDLLKRQGYLKDFPRTNDHMRDALRHALYYERYGGSNNENGDKDSQEK